MFFFLKKRRINMKMINGTILNPFYILLSLDTCVLTHIRILGLGSDVRIADRCARRSRRKQLGWAVEFGEKSATTLEPSLSKRVSWPFSSVSTFSGQHRSLWFEDGRLVSSYARPGGTPKGIRAYYALLQQRCSNPFPLYFRISNQCTLHFKIQAFYD